MAVCRIDRVSRFLEQSLDLAVAMPEDVDELSLEARIVSTIEVEPESAVADNAVAVVVARAADASGDPVTVGGGSPSDEATADPVEDDSVEEAVDDDPSEEDAGGGGGCSIAGPSAGDRLPMVLAVGALLALCRRPRGGSGSDVSGSAR